MEVSIKKKSVKKIKENYRNLLIPILLLFSVLFGITIIPNFLSNNNQFIFQPMMNSHEGINNNFFPLDKNKKEIFIDNIQNIKIVNNKYIDDEYKITNNIMKYKKRQIFRTFLFLIIVVIAVLMLILIIEKNNNRRLMRRYQRRIRNNYNNINNNIINLNDYHNI